MLQRMIGVLTLKRSVYQEIRQDASANMQAAIVVFIVGLASAFGGALLLSNFSTRLIGHIIWVYVGWALATTIVFLLGTKVFGGKASFGEVMRLFETFRKDK